MKLTHITADLAGIAYDLLDDPERLLQTMNESVRCAGLSPVAACAHKFDPHGASAVVILAESHLSIHTWPEEGFAAVDLLSCGSPAAAARAIEELKVRLGASRADVGTMPRGALLAGDSAAPAAPPVQVVAQHGGVL